MERLFRYLGLVGLILFVCGCQNPRAGFPVPDVSIHNMEKTVLYLSMMEPSRSCRYPESLKKSADYIAQQFSQYGCTPVRQEFEVFDKTYENIIASVGPEDKKRVVVGAHYDAFGEHAGADDNASAVAGLLEMARFAKQHEDQLNVRVDFVAYTLEEPPHFATTNMGSYVHAKVLHDEGVKVKGMICLEMLGYYSDGKGSQSYPANWMHRFYPDTGNFIAVISNFGSSSLVRHVAQNLETTEVPVETLKAPAFLVGVDFSDHRNYWEFGYDAVMVTDTAFYRNPNYHENSDTIDTLDFEKMKEVVSGLCWALLDF